MDVLVVDSGVGFVVVGVEVAPWALACLVRLRQDAAEVQRRHLDSVR